MKIAQNIAIAGAGIVGLSAACALAEAGHKVIVYDPGCAASPDNASAQAAGMLAPYAEIDHMPPDLIDAGLNGINFWAEFAKGHSIDFHHKGSLLLAHSEDRHMLERFKSHLPSGSNSWNSVDRASISALEPDLAGRFSDGIYLPQEAHLDPGATMRTLRERAEACGAVFIAESAAVRMLAADHDIALDCRGMAAQHEEENLRGVKGEIVILRNPELTLSRLVRLMHPRYPLYIAPRADHIFAVGATQIESTGSAHVSLRSALELLSAAYSLHPSFGEAEVLEIRAGIRPAYPDNLPRITIEKNVIRCNGLFRHGYLLAPVMAQCMADFIAGKENQYMHLFTRTHENYHQR
ncbi:MAG: glycine oxidase ThiO [Alphaproteobacteria bacterium]|nr:glycine oxidase ThiO [Alphaproteobacteria bacterium]